MPRFRKLMVILFFCVLAVRFWFYSGFIMLDDLNDINLFTNLLAGQFHSTDQYYYRLFSWIPYWIGIKLLGFNEWGYFFPTLLISSALPLAGFTLLRHWGYSTRLAAIATLFIATTPMAMLGGAMRTNDMFLEAAAAFGLVALLKLEKKPVAQGILVAVLFWIAFYIKIWAVYFLPALGLYYLHSYRSRGAWKGAAAFVAVSAVMHSVTCLIWKSISGFYFPQIPYTTGPIAIEPGRIWEVWAKYPYFLFVGNEALGTTVFGMIPHLLLIMVAAKAWLNRGKSGSRFDSADKILFFYYLSFFFLLEFFPNGFKLDAYYSVGRTFRYLFPLSFPMTLHVVKLAFDVAPSRTLKWAAGLGLAANFLLGVNAMGPLQSHHKAFRAVGNVIAEECPPAVVMEPWSGKYLQLSPVPRKCPAAGTDSFYKFSAGMWGEMKSDHHFEETLRKIETELPKGTLLVTGTGRNPIPRACLTCGILLSYFQAPLSPSWHLLREFEPESYLPAREPVRVWQLR
jgi:hypothetical protein